MAKAKITSPSCMPARAAASVEASTRTPPLTLSSFFWASVRSLIVKPKNFAALEVAGFSAGAAAFLAGASGSNSPTVICLSTKLPRRQTWMVLFVPGLVLPTMRGKSEDFSMGLPSNFKMMSPGSNPAFSAGEPCSTPRTKAPCVFASPKDSATSLLTWSICTPRRPRCTRPVVRSCSLTRMASSIGMANEMPINPPERE